MEQACLQFYVFFLFYLAFSQTASEGKVRSTGSRAALLNSFNSFGEKYVKKEGYFTNSNMFFYLFDNIEIIIGVDYLI